MVQSTQADYLISPGGEQIRAPPVLDGKVTTLALTLARSVTLILALTLALTMIRILI